MNSGFVDLIYLDPPFNSNHNYSAPIGSEAAGAAFKDTWTLQDVDKKWHGYLADKHPPLHSLINAVGEVHSDSMKSYLIYMAIRILEMKRLLKNDGSIYLHCDPTASHYLKLAMDAVFGKKKFINEVIWCYSQGGRSGKRFGRKHDCIYYYTKTSRYKFNKDAVGIPMTPHKQDKTGKSYGGKMGVTDDGRQYVEKQGTRDKQGNYKYYRYYLDTGKVPEDWWADINSIQAGADERTSYPTQKPLKLLERIIKASSNDGDIVFDPFCGCATTCVAAQSLNRNWIGIDISPKAGELIELRMRRDLGLFFDGKLQLNHQKDTRQI